MLCAVGEGISMLWGLCVLCRRRGKPPRENRREAMIAARGCHGGGC